MQGKSVVVSRGATDAWSMALIAQNSSRSTPNFFSLTMVWVVYDSSEWILCLLSESWRSSALVLSWFEWRSNVGTCIRSTIYRLGVICHLCMEDTLKAIDRKDGWSMFWSTTPWWAKKEWVMHDHGGIPTNSPPNVPLSLGHGSFGLHFRFSLLWLVDQG